MLAPHGFVSIRATQDKRFPFATHILEMSQVNTVARNGATVDEQEVNYQYDNLRVPASLLASESTAKQTGTTGVQQSQQRLYLLSVSS